MSEFRKAVPAQDTPQEPQKPVTDGSGGTDTKVPDLIATYQEDQGKPYVAQYLDIGEIWDKENTLKNELNTIEGFIRDEVKKGNLENSTKAADKFLKELEKKAETNPYETATKRISKILAYIEFKRVVNG